MPSERSPARAGLACSLLAVLAGCALQPQQPAPAPEPQQIAMMAPTMLPPDDARVPAATSTPDVDDTRVLAEAIGYAGRVRGLAPTELGQEIQRLGASAYAPLHATQLALALGQSRNPANTARAQLLLQRVIADGAPAAQPLQPLARLLLAQIGDQRRADEQAERQAQQLREAQRRIEQLSERLEAVRAIERSLPGPARRESHRP